MRTVIAAGALGLLLWHGSGAADDGVIRVGSKSFTESYILAEIVAQVIERTGEARVERQLGLGGTGITLRAIVSGAIDIYPEYTGTLSRVVLKDPALVTPDAIRARLVASGLTISEPLGFNNTYALAVRADTAERLGLAKISDLSRHDRLTAVFTSGFLEREDGWPGLKRHYGLAIGNVRVMEHALTYRAIAAGEVDVMDVFSTDGQLERLRLRILKDDRGFFPDYSAVLLARRDMAERYPRTWARLREVLEGSLDDRRMSALNAMADLDGKSVPEVAAAFAGTASPDAHRRSGLAAEIYALTLDHLVLVLVALSLYALLPIVRSTYAGLIAIDGHLIEIAFVLGLGRLKRLVRIELPLASISIMAGIKTSAVMTVGTATLAAFIGGGGYGTLIVRGLALDDTATILAGAAPAAVMAVAFHALFELLDRLAIPRGLRR